MTIQQLSIFIENRPGTLIRVLNVLKQAHIQIIASTLADTAEYGIYRLNCSNPQLALQALKATDLPVMLSDVFAIELDDEPGRAADAVAAFTAAGINIAYMYSFLFHGKGILILRTDQPDLTRQVIERNGMKFLSENELP